VTPPTARQLAELAEAVRVLREQEAKHAGDDPVAFARLCQLTPDPWQERLLRAQGNVLLNCSRQAGKSTGASLLVVHRAVTQPGHLALLISPSERQSKELFRKVRTFLDRVPGGVRLTEDNVLSCTLANGSRIVSLPSSEHTIRGYSAVNTLIEDEAAFVDDALNVAVRPMLAVSGGQMILMSTPNGRRGHFFEAWEGTGTWHRERVTCWEVPRIPKAFLEEERRVLREMFRQEYECEFINALTGRVYRHDDVLNVIDAAPEMPRDLRGWSFLCGLDFGVIDQNAIAVLGWRDNDPCVYVLESYRFTGSPSEMADEVAKLAKRYPFERIIGDVGGLGKGYQDEARKRQHLPIEPAEKHNKVGYIRLLNDDLGRGRIKVVRDKCQQLLEEWRDLPWAENQQKEADGFNNHCADATLYAWRAAYAFIERPPPPPKTLEEAYREEERALEEASEEEAQRIEAGEWWEVA
jgi:hypothetical protein